MEFGVVYVQENGGLAVDAIAAPIARPKADGVGHLVVACPAVTMRRAVRNGAPFIFSSVSTDTTAAGIDADVLRGTQAHALMKCFNFLDLESPISSPDAPGVLAEAMARWASNTLEFGRQGDKAPFEIAGFVLKISMAFATGLACSCLSSLSRDRRIEVEDSRSPALQRYFQRIWG